MKGRSLTGRTMFLLATRVAGLILGMGVTVVLGRSLGKEGLGTFTLAQALVGLGTTFADSGLGSLFTREVIAQPGIEKSLFRWTILARTALGTLLAVVLGGLGLALVDTAAGRTCVIAIMATMPMFGMTLGLNVLQRHLRVWLVSTLLLGQSVVWFVMVLWLGAGNAGLAAFGFAFFAYNVVYSVIVYWFGSRAVEGVGIDLDFTKFRKLMRDAVPMGIATMLVTAYYKLDSVLVYFFNGSGESGLYGLAFRFLDQASVIPLTLGMVFGPLLNHSRTPGGPSTRAVFQNYVQTTLNLAVPAVGAGIVFSHWFVVRVFGPDFVGAVLPLRLLLIAFLPICLGWAITGTAIAGRQVDQQLRTAVIGLVVNVVLNVALIPHFGARAAAATTLATELAVAAFLYRRIRKPCDVALPWRWIARMLVALVGGLCAAAPLITSNPLIATAVFLVVYVALALVLKVISKETVKIVDSRPGKKASVAADELISESGEDFPHGS